MKSMVLVALLFFQINAQADELDQQKIYACTLHPQSKPGAPTGDRFKVDLQRTSLLAYSTTLSTCTGRGNIVSSHNGVFTVKATMGGGMCQSQGFELEWASSGAFVPGSSFIAFVNYKANGWARSFYFCQRIQ